jgi:hypothetical protein
MFRTTMIFVFLAFSAAAIACGGGGSGGSNGSGDSTGAGTTQSFQCCLNGDYYDCPSQGTVDACFNASDPSGCTHTHTDPTGNCN